MTKRRIVVAGLAILVTTGALLAWQRPQWLDELSFLFRLYRAHREANRFYANFPWVTKNIAYHPEMPRRLDVYRPETGSGYPVIVYVYGGSWTRGNKELYAPAAQRFLPSGFVLVIRDYVMLQE